MADSRKYTSSGLFLMLLVIIFFSLLRGERNKHNETNQSAISYSANYCSRAIIVPEISTPGNDIFQIKWLNKKINFFDYNSSKELILSKLISSYYNSHLLEIHSINPIIGLIFPQKIPEQGNDDDFLSIT